MKNANIKITISYDGTFYSGWQRQEDKKTIQGCLENALKKIYKKRIRLIGAGRTDAGVHALAQVANFFPPHTKITAPNLLRALNSLLSEDIRITGCEYADADFHARFSAKGKEYLYLIYNSPAPLPFFNRYSWLLTQKLDFKKMRSAARHITGRHDFASFASSGSTVKSTVKTLKKLKVTSSPPFIILHFYGNGFLKQMVRNIVGTLVEVGSGRFTPQKVREILLAKDRRKAGRCAPAKGLFLLGVEY